MTNDLTQIDGVGPAIAEQLRESGFETVDQVRKADVDELAGVHLIGPDSAEAILEGNDEAHGGRPSKLTDERCDDALRAAREGKSKAGCARAAGVSHSTLADWVESDDEFRTAFRRARAQGESELIEGGLRDDEVDSSMAKFLLASSFDYKKTEKREVTGDDGGPVEVEFNETVVETEWSEE